MNRHYQIRKRRLVAGIRRSVLVLLLFNYLTGTAGGIPTASDVVAETVMLAGAAHADITPDVHVKNWITGEAYPGIRDSLYARVLIMGDGQQKAVIVHWELVDAGESATDRIRTEISEKLNIPSGNILVNAAHNHSAPWSPVYGEDNKRGQERYPWWVTRYMPAQDEEPYFAEWKEKLIRQTVKAAEEADRKMEAVSLWIGRYDVSRYLYNRRPRTTTEKPEESGWPEGYGFNHPDWDPDILPGNQTFGEMDRTLTLLSFRNGAGENVASLFHFSCHAVSIYPYLDDLSGDWPGALTARLNLELGGESLFVQGTAGDIAPWRRGPEAVEEMSEGLKENILKTYRYSARYAERPLKIDRTFTGIPLTEYGRKRTGLNSMEAEIQAMIIGPLALISLPGEPMTGIGRYIRDHSPYEQTMVLGYSNGNGGHYCGMPGEKAYGGYESGEATSLGSDRAGLIMGAAAIELLEKMKM